jgi:hypothetical protein
MPQSSRNFSNRSMNPIAFALQNRGSRQRYRNMDSYNILFAGFGGSIGIPIDVGGTEGAFGALLWLYISVLLGFLVDWEASSLIVTLSSGK